MAPNPSGHDIYQAVLAVDWSAWVERSAVHRYRPAAVPAAFRQLLAVADKQEANAAGNSMLDAIGHNHAGWLYAAAVSAAPLLARCVCECEDWVCFAALDILADCLIFAADPDHQVEIDGTKTRITDAVAAAVWNRRADVERLARDESATIPIAPAARQLLADMDDGR